MKFFMAPSASRSDFLPRFNVWLFATFVGLVFLFGGASRADAASQPVLRILSVLVLAVWAFQLRSRHLRAAAMPWAFLVAAFALVAIQLVPLPPALWTAFPGREPFLEGYRLAGVEPGWHSLSLTPDRTLNSLLALLPPIAIGAGLSVIDRERLPDLVLLLILLIVLSAVVAIAQISTGAPYLYRITNDGSAVGLFANRNHQALLLAIGFPLLACLANEYHSDGSNRHLHNWLAWFIGILLVPMLLVTGSRAGLFLGVGGALAALAIGRSSKKNGPRKRGAAAVAGRFAPFVLVALAGVATIFLARDLSLQRLLSENVGTDDRTQNFAIYVHMARDYMPFGAGYGAFDPVYRMYEPPAALRLTYLNNAHNDLAQVAIEGGILGLALAAAFVCWFLFHAVRLWLPPSRGRAKVFGRTGSAIILLILLGSLGDYPLRTPIHVTLMVIAIFLVLAGSESKRPRAPKASLDRFETSANPSGSPARAGAQ